ncbi:hypothetical protein PsorP6_008072 [Peronosclerospora sorghi]|uniref:Uncharacterized protein n=1 Tax=Peronosclerospora sorghi TaxID=230839 RepID=A0ACC0W7W9_9STRA|nr:hypothetical protein PsorP6_008072 [Peronosclerospora sorghi]
MGFSARLVNMANGSYYNANFKVACVDARHEMLLKCLAGARTDIIVGREFDHVLLGATGAADDHSLQELDTSTLNLQVSCNFLSDLP